MIRRIRALAIAPYEGLCNMIEQISKTRNDIEITTYLGNLELGADLVSRIDQSKYDVIISRGGTAKMIKEVTKLPVVEIMLSHYDVLNCIKLAENYPGKFAIIGFPSIANFAKVLCDILQLDIIIATLHSTSETFQRLSQLKKQGVTMVLTDTTAIEKAKEMGMNAMLITSNMESIETAIEQAVQLNSYYIDIANQNFYYNAALEDEHKKMIVYAADSDTLLFSNIDDSQTGFLGMTRKFLPHVKQYGTHESVQKTGKEYYRISGFKADVRQSTVIIFIMKQAEFYRQPVIQGVKSTIESEIVPDSIAFLYNSWHSKIKATLEQYSRSSKPVLIIGEEGTGKDEIAQIIFRDSSLSHRTLYTVDFLALEEKGWHYLLDNPFSYFLDNNNTFHLKNIWLLQENKRKDLFAFIENTKLDKRNRLIFSLQYHNQEVTELPAYQMIMNSLECLTIRAAPLRERPEDIPGLVSFFLNEHNGLNAGQISGCEPEGMQLLQKFEWEYNLKQFRRVINALATTADSTFISTKSIKDILKEESRSIRKTHAQLPEISFDKTLDEIVYDVAVEVLKREKSNQTKAAKKLGISRTTLWRILNK